MSKIAVIDYGVGNTGSILKKLRRIGQNSILASSRNDIENVSKIILPGVGHFTSSVRNLKRSGLWDELNESVVHKKLPILGICLGMQLMSKKSEEGNEDGFGWIEANVVRFKVEDKIRYKIPHIGWNTIEVKKKSPIFEGVDLAKGFYFVHSFHLECHNQEDVLATTDYSYPFVSVVQKDHIFGVQFHPEKSHDWGEIFLLNFLKL